MDISRDLRGLWVLVLLLVCVPSDGVQFPPIKPGEHNVKAICDNPLKSEGLSNEEKTVNLLGSRYRRCCLNYEPQKDVLGCLLKMWAEALTMYCSQVKMASHHCCRNRDVLPCFSH